MLLSRGGKFNWQNWSRLFVTVSGRKWNIGDKYYVNVRNRRNNVTIEVKMKTKHTVGIIGV
jgi:hypothetical protein